MKKEMTLTTPSEAETSTNAGGINQSNLLKKVTFSALARRLISFCREDIIKMKDGNEGSHFATIVELFHPTHPKMKQIQRNYHQSIIFDNHECIQNVLFILKILTEILQSKKNGEECTKSILVGDGSSTSTSSSTSTTSSSGGSGPGETLLRNGLETFEDIQIMMTRNSACYLIIEILSTSPFYLLKKQAILYGIELFWNGNLESQQSLLSYLKKHNCVQFFQSIYEELQELIHIRKEINFLRKKKRNLQFNENDEDTSSSSTSGISNLNLMENDRNSIQVLVDIYRFIQLLCEGHNHEIQMLLEDQSGLYSSQIQNHQMYSIQKSYGLLSQTITLLNEFFPTKDDPHSMDMDISITNEDSLAIKAMLDFLIEAVQGPCHFNQDILASNPMFVDVIDRIWHATGFAPSKNDKLHTKPPVFTKEEKSLPVGYYTMKTLKITALTLRLSLLEGRKLTPTDIVVQMFTQNDNR